LEEHETFCTNFYANIYRQSILTRTHVLPKEREMARAKRHVVWAQRAYSFEEKIGQDSALSYMPFYYEEDRFYSDHVELSSIMSNTFYLNVNTMETFKSFHFCEYEYFVEEEDFFEQAYGDSHMAPSILLIHAYVLMMQLQHPVYFIWIIPFIFLYCIVIVEIYEIKTSWELFPYYNSSSVSTSRDNFQGEAPALYYANRDYVHGYSSQAYDVPEITLFYEHDEDPFYHEDNGGGGALFAYPEDSGFDDNFDGENEIIPPDDEFNDYDPFDIPYYDFPLFMWLSLHAPNKWTKLIDKYVPYIAMFDKHELDIVDEVLLQGTEQENGYFLREGDIDGHLEYLESVGEIDEGTGEDYLHDHPEFMERGTWNPIESHISTVFFPFLSYYEEGEDDEETEWSIQHDTPPDEMAEEDELDEDEDDPREFEEDHHESAAEFDDIDYSCDEDQQDLASETEFFHIESEGQRAWRFPNETFLASEMSILASMRRLVRYLILNREIMTLDYDEYKSIRQRNRLLSIYRYIQTKKYWI
jgi:hypothetical protein